MAPEKAPEGLEEFDQDSWLEQQMALSRQIAAMYSNGDEQGSSSWGMSDSEEEDYLQPLEGSERRKEAPKPEPSMDGTTAWESRARGSAASALEAGTPEEDEEQPEPDLDAVDGPAENDPRELATGRSATPSPSTVPLASDMGKVSIDSGKDDDFEAEQTLQSLLAAAAAATAAAAPMPRNLLSAEDHQRLKAKRRPPPKGLLAEEVAARSGDKSVGRSSAGSDGLFERTGPITPRKESTATSIDGSPAGSLAAEVAALSRDVIAAYSPGPGTSWS